MLSIELFRKEAESVAQGLTAKKADGAQVSRVLELDTQRKEITTQAEALKKERNETSKQIGSIIKDGGDAEPIKARVRQIGETIKQLDEQLRDVQEQLQTLLLSLPNLPHASAPIGTGEDDNKFLREEGDKPSFDFTPRAHWDVAADLDILDLERGTKISGSGFFVLKGAGARLQRALINFMLDLHTEEHGYRELRAPYLVNRQSMTGTGQLPKMEDDMYRIEDDLFLIPTAEVPVTNLHGGEILDAADLPLAYACYSPCFRREAGAAGKENRGMSRVHQFDKVEMVRTVLPENSYDEMELLRGHAETVLQKLGLQYRVLELCSGDMSFAAAKCYDLEVWAPGMDIYLEVSSCSNFEDFQARRANIRFRREKGAKPEFVHTLNASGVALPRLMIAIIENFQQADGSIALPEVLHRYMGCASIKI